ncbi:methyl-accepting chemotaxis protein [Cohnella hongkongensis]|uniref:Methyl-accepting chemotaxis protein n=1 Tax=Cohnella hongkongensis TaxID=178337 RepID=A0ABV9FG75_9BACL
MIFEANRKPAAASDNAPDGQAAAAERGLALLSQSSGQITSIARIVRDIAGKTNSMALDAAVEAAGPDSGAGFAFSEQEVRQLAEDTAAAAREIDELIRQAHDRMDEVVGSSKNPRTFAALGGRQAALAELDRIGEALSSSIAMIGRVETELDSLLRTIGKIGPAADPSAESADRKNAAAPED